MDVHKAFVFFHTFTINFDCHYCYLIAAHTTLHCPTVTSAAWVTQCAPCTARQRRRCARTALLAIESHKTLPRSVISLTHTVPTQLNGLCTHHGCHANECGTDFVLYWQTRCGIRHVCMDQQEPMGWLKAMPLAYFDMFIAHLQDIVQTSPAVARCTAGAHDKNNVCFYLFETSLSLVKSSREAVILLKSRHD